MAGINDLDTNLPMQRYQGPSANDIAMKGTQIADLMDQRAIRNAQVQRQLQQRQVMAQNANNQGQIPQAMTQAGLGPEAMDVQKQQAEIQQSQAMANYHNQIAQDYLAAHGKGAMALEQLKASYGSNIANTFLQGVQSKFGGNWNAPEAKYEYENAVVPELRRAGVTPDQAPDQFDLSVPARLDLLSKQGYSYAQQMKDKIGQTTADAAATKAGASQQNADTATQAEQDKAKYQQGLLSNQSALTAVKAQKVRAALSSTPGGGKLTDLDKQELEEAKSELQGRGSFGIATKKIDAAIDTRAALNRYYDPATGQYNVPSSAYGELTTSLSLN